MRGAWIGLGMLVATVCSTSMVWSQGVLEGPLAAPDAPIAKSGPSAKPDAKPKKHRAKKAEATQATKERRSARATPASVPDPKPSETANPLSLGMKWSGSNDNAEQTRVQNYGGSAAGTGAEVGLKLHF